MKKITILPETTPDPISLIGRRAGVCWGADITDKEKNYKKQAMQWGTFVI